MKTQLDELKSQTEEYSVFKIISDDLFLKKSTQSDEEFCDFF